ncbi:MAG TPA: Fic family protein [Methylophilaceae bacterium]|nr:Fic family protein [Methylophilaceae bacterium]
MLDSALARPVNLAAYGEPDFADLVACYGAGLAQNHPFVDGNKCAAFLAVGLFLFLNGKRLTATQVDALSPCSRWPPASWKKPIWPLGYGKTVRTNRIIANN